MAINMFLQPAIFELFGAKEGKTLFANKVANKIVNALFKTVLILYDETKFAYDIFINTAKIKDLLAVEHVRSIMPGVTPRAMPIVMKYYDCIVKNAYGKMYSVSIENSVQLVFQFALLTSRIVLTSIYRYTFGYVFV